MTPEAPTLGPDLPPARWRLEEPRERRALARALHLDRRPPPHPLRRVDRGGRWRWGRGAWS